MVAYFVRRIVWGIIQLWLVSFIIFYIAVELPGGPRDGPTYQLNPPLSSEDIWFQTRNSHIDKPWPLNYVDWLFDPYAVRLWSNGEDYGYHTQASGVLTGDLSSSTEVVLGAPVGNMFGHGIGVVFAFLISLIAALMAIATAQRLGRPRPYRICAAPTASALADWWHLHGASPSGVIINRQRIG